MASYENRGNGVWRVVISNGYDAAGKKKRLQRTIYVDPKKTLLSQEREVEREAAKIQADFDRQQITDAKKLTFKKVYDGYLEDRIIRKGLAPQTVDSYKELFERKLIPSFGKTAIRDITAHDLNLFFRKLKKKVKDKETGKFKEVNVSGTYARKYYQQLNELFRYAQKSGYIVTNPCTLIDAPSIDTQEAQYYDISEIPAILEAIKKYPDPEWRCYFTMQFYVGSRPEEMTGLNWTDYNGSDVSITAGAYQGKGEKCKRTDRPKSKKSNRKIQLPPDAISAMDAWKKAQAAKQLKSATWADTDAVFTNAIGERISLQTPAKRWKRFTNENGIRPLPLYSLRHTNCSLLIASQEITVKEVSDQMGHAQTSTTLNIYAHVFRNSNKRATNALMNMVNAAKQEKAE